MTKDFSGQNLRGRSFKGQNLEGANFSGADIRGTDFTNANLMGANFSYAKAGLQHRQRAKLEFTSYLLSILAGVFSGLHSYWELNPDDNVLVYIGVRLASLISLLFFFQITIRQGLVFALGICAIATAVGTALYSVSNLIGFLNPITSISYTALAIAFTFVAEIVTLSITFTLTLTFARAKTIYLIIVIFTITSILISITFCFFQEYHQQFFIIITISILRSIIFVIIGIKLSYYTSQYTLNGDQENNWILSFIIDFATIGSTSFHNANLTDTNFTQAILPNTNFIKANITRTRFFEAQYLHLSSVSDSILNKRDILNLLVSCNGSEKKIIGANLRGANLVGADLTDANLKEANISEATFKNACLERANLTKTQAIETNFTNALMTGACVESWNIEHTTNLDNVDCDYIYLLEKPKPGTKDRERRPSSGEFKTGEFCKLFQEVINTVDFIFKKGIDWKAFIAAFKTIQVENEDIALAIQSIEIKDNGFVVVKVSVPPETSKEKIHSDFQQNYQLALQAVEEKYKVLLQAKDEQIVDYHHNNANMLTIINQLASRPITIDIKATSESYSMSEAPKKISQYNLQGAQFGGGLVNADKVNAQQIGGNINNHSQAAQTDKNSDAKTILILAANPKTTSTLRLDEEVREIDAGLQRAKKREFFDLKQRWAVRVQDVYQSLLDFKPQIVHFSGHGTGDDGLALEDETGRMQLVDTVALAGLFELFASDIECVVLNACYSEVQAIAIAQHISYVIGMNKAIGDRAAIKFATGFYSALRAGESVEFAYKLGCNVIQLDGIPEHLTPVLKKK